MCSFGFPRFSFCGYAGRPADIVDEKPSGMKMGHFVMLLFPDMVSWIHRAPLALLFRDRARAAGEGEGEGEGEGGRAHCCTVSWCLVVCASTLLDV